MSVTSDDIVQVPRSIFFRFEPRIKENNLFIYVGPRHRILRGNEDAFRILNRVDGHRTVADIARSVAADTSEDPVAVLAATLEILHSFEEEGVVTHIESR